MDYISQFVAAKNREHEETLAFMIYVSESMRLRGENKFLQVKLTDILFPDMQKEEITAEEAKNNILSEFAKLNRGDADGSGD